MRIPKSKLMRLDKEYKSLEIFCLIGEYIEWISHIYTRISINEVYKFPDTNLSNAKFFSNHLFFLLNNYKISNGHNQPGCMMIFNSSSGN